MEAFDLLTVAAADSSALAAAGGVFTEAAGALSAEGVGGSSDSPSSSRIAIAEPTGALPPSGIEILERIPSSKASISMVALSVSISAIISPISTSSPSFLSQRTTVPSVMVSESLGISILIGIVLEIWVYKIGRLPRRGGEIADRDVLLKDNFADLQEGEVA